METWEEIDPPQRPPAVTAWVEEFLTQCPDERRAKFREFYDEEKRTSRRLADYRMDPRDVIEGKLVSFADVLGDQGSMSEGGAGYTYDFEHEGREYLIEDRYCPNPDCDCQTVHLDFFEAVSREDGEKGAGRSTRGSWEPRH